MPSTADPQALLDQALVHLDFCTTKGVIIDQTVVDDILTHKDILAQSGGKIKNSFYTSIGRLESVYQQVLDSIACTHGWTLNRGLSVDEKYLWSRIFRSYGSMAQMIFFTIALFAAILLAYFGTQYFLGSSLLKACNQAIVNADTTRQQYITELTKQMEAKDSKAPHNTGPINATDNPDDELKDVERETLSEKERDSYSDQTTCLGSLQSWNAFTIDSFDWVLPKACQLKGMLTPVPPSPYAEYPGSVPRDRGPMNHACAVSQLLITFINSVLCASLGGVLGSCVYVIRIINIRANKHDLWDDCIGTYLARLLLGAICGTVVGYLPANALGGADSTTLSPILLSFIAGYNIELVFTALDKLMQAFTTTSPNASKDNPPRG